MIIPTCCEYRGTFTAHRLSYVHSVHYSGEDRVTKGWVVVGHLLGLMKALAGCTKEAPLHVEMGSTQGSGNISATDVTPHSARIDKSAMAYIKQVE